MIGRQQPIWQPDLLRPNAATGECRRNSVSARLITERRHLIGLAKIIRRANTNLLELIARGIRHMARDGSDPLHSLGVLVEGAVHLLSTSVPADRRHEAVSAVTTVLQDRLVAHDLV
jgi:hypothetical protein